MEGLLRENPDPWGLFVVCVWPCVSVWGSVCMYLEVRALQIAAYPQKMGQTTKKALW